MSKKIVKNMKRKFAVATGGIFASSPAFAQDIFAAPTSFLTQIQTFVLGAPGVLLGGAAIALTAILAASPRTSVEWGTFFKVLVVLAIFYGSFTIAAIIQGFGG